MIVRSGCGLCSAPRGQPRLVALGLQVGPTIPSPRNGSRFTKTILNEQNEDASCSVLPFNTLSWDHKIFSNLKHLPPESLSPEGLTVVTLSDAHGKLAWAGPQMQLCVLGWDFNSRICVKALRSSRTSARGRRIELLHKRPYLQQPAACALRLSLFTSCRCPTYICAATSLCPW